MSDLTLKPGGSLTLNARGMTLAPGGGPLGLTLKTVPTPDQGAEKTIDDLEDEDAARQRAVLQHLETADAIASGKAGKDIAEAAKRELARFADSTDTAYWCCVVFQSSEARAEFMLKSGWVDHGTELYVCGEDVAKLMGITLETPVPEMPKRRQNKNLIALSRRFTDNGQVAE